MTARRIAATLPALLLFGLLLAVAGVGVSVFVETARGLSELGVGGAASAVGF